MLPGCAMVHRSEGPEFERQYCASNRASPLRFDGSTSVPQSKPAAPRGRSTAMGEPLRNGFAIAPSEVRGSSVVIDVLRKSSAASFASLAISTSKSFFPGGGQTSGPIWLPQKYEI